MTAIPDHTDGPMQPIVWSVDLSNTHFAWWSGWHATDVPNAVAMLGAAVHLAEGRRRTVCADCAHTTAPFVIVLDEVELFSEFSDEEDREQLAGAIDDIRSGGPAYNVHIMGWEAWDTRRNEVWPKDQTRRADVVYHGRMVEHRGGVIVIEAPDGRALGTVPHVVKHSPTGIGWGYEGSGAADTALSLLADAMGEAAVCQLCKGSRKVVYGAGEESYRFDAYDAAKNAEGAYKGREIEACSCDMGLVELPYQDFKRQVVSVWPEQGEWRISRAHVLAWLSSQHGGALLDRHN